MELYNLKDDPSETTNLAAQRPELVAELHQQLDAWRRDPQRFVDYNLSDARLALDILAELRLVELAVERSLLTGLPIDRVAGSIAAFDFLYLTELHRRGIVAPSVGATATGAGNPGGHVLEPETMEDKDTVSMPGLEVGDFVVAIGNPFGLGQTVTSGIVSALGRTGLGIEGYEDFIQTDASINPGNSGGPLINMKGEVVGINTAIIAAGSGIGFAIPINLAEKIIAQLKSEGEVTRGWLGVAIQDLNSDMAEYLPGSHRQGRIEKHLSALYYLHHC